MKKQILILILILCITSIFAQNFEGTVTYKIELLNPNKKLISDSAWNARIMKQQNGRDYFMLQKYYYKIGDYMSEINTGNEIGYQIFNPKDKLLYNFQKNSDTATTNSSKNNSDEITSITRFEKDDTILNIPCDKIVLKTTSGEIQLWFNSNYLKMDSKYYTGHKFGFWEQILNEIKCIPLKMETKGFMTRILQTATEYKAIEVNSDIFKIPSFKTIISNDDY